VLYSVIVGVFDPVTVKVSLDSTNIQHQKLKIDLVEPQVGLCCYVV